MIKKTTFPNSNTLKIKGSENCHDLNDVEGLEDWGDVNNAETAEAFKTPCTSSEKTHFERTNFSAPSPESTLGPGPDEAPHKKSHGAKQDHTLLPLRALLIRSESGPLTLKHSARLDENKGLAKALGLNLMDVYVCRLRRSPHPATFLGKGWVERITQTIAAQNIQVVIMDPDLTSIQQRVLEKTWKCDILDRTALILRIFQQRARTAAGQLQVQLASLLYQKSRLVRAWTHLERQRGGFGFLGGPGESQLELDRRILENQTLKVKKQLEQVRKTRSLHRKSRQGFPTLALVGYTNTGKSTLFRTLTRSDVFCADMPFATLDPTVRKIRLPSGRFAMLTDTVGFISELPSFLKLAFQATLEEIHAADLIIHVRDKACITSDLQKADVLSLLQDLKCTQPIIEVWNKADLVPHEQQKDTPALWISATEKIGISDLLNAIDLAIDPENKDYNFVDLENKDPNLMESPELGSL
jgi:GTP-binding protein HflX